MSILFVYTQLNVQTVIFQTILFSLQKQFYFKQFSFALESSLNEVRSLNEIYSSNLKTVLFQAIPFSISTKFSSI